MKKTLERLTALFLCAVLLTGCAYRSAPVAPEPAATLPPAQSPYAAPVGDASLAYDGLAALALPSVDGQRLLTRYAEVSLSSGRHSAESVVRALLAFPGDEGAAPLGGQTPLALYGPRPVETSGDVCTVNLTSTALQLSDSALYTVSLALAATLCALPDIHYVNLLVADRPVSMDITGTLPLGSVTARPGEELPVLWEQMESRRTPLGENPVLTPLTSAATLYFPLEGGAGVAPETRNLSFAGQSAQQQVLELISALSAGAQFARDTVAMPDLSRQMILAPEILDQEDGGRIVTLHFGASIENVWREAGADPVCLTAAIAMTLETFVPGVTAVRFFAGDALITSLRSDTHGLCVYEDGLHTRREDATLLMKQTTLYFASGDRLTPVLRAMRPEDASSPRALLNLLLAGPTQREADAGVEPLFPEGLSDADILGVAIEDDTLLVNLSARAAAMIRDEAADWEQTLCYGVVNTLCEAKGLRRARFFFDGQAVETLGGTLYWGGEFLLNPAMVNKTMG